MRSRIATCITALVLVAACSGDANPAPTWRYGPIGSAPAGGPGASPSGSQSASPAPGSAAPTAAATPAGEATEITIGTDPGTALRFDPEAPSVAGGGTVRVTFKNVSTVPHNLTFQEPINAATSTIVDAGGSETIKFQAPGPGDYPFVCTLHPGMDGILTIQGP